MQTSVGHKPVSLRHTYAWHIKLWSRVLTLFQKHSYVNVWGLLQLIIDNSFCGYQSSGYWDKCAALACVLLSLYMQIYATVANTLLVRISMVVNQSGPRSASNSWRTVLQQTPSASQSSTAASVAMATDRCDVFTCMHGDRTLTWAASCRLGVVLLATTCQKRCALHDRLQCLMVVKDGEFLTVKPHPYWQDNCEQD